GVKLHYT
nr:Chain C, spike tail hepta-peptide [Severe acute respiratory syndrome coronavirus 2]